jgi:hypothetical protein
MPWWGWLLLAVWFAVATFAAVALGRVIRERDRHDY